MDDPVLCLSNALRLEVNSELGDGLESVKDEDLLAAIKRMAVLVSNPRVYRNEMKATGKGRVRRSGVSLQE